MKSVAVIVLSWNKSRHVIECIDRLKRADGLSPHVVVVDNASTDDSVAAIRAAHPDVALLAEPVNRGFAGGVNRGLAEADRLGCDVAWLLNDDTVFDDQVLTTLLERADTCSDGALVSPLLRDLDSRAADQFRNGLVDWASGTMGQNYAVDRFEALRARGATPIVPGTALLIDLRVYRAIGPFDARFFAYWEDTDYAVRAARAGFECVVVPDAVVEHAAPSSDVRPPHYHYYMVRNEALFWHLHGEGKVRWHRGWLSRSLARIGRNRDLGRPQEAGAVVDAIWHAWRRRWGARHDHWPAPRAVHAVLMARPYLWSHVALGEYGLVLRRLVRR